MSLLSHQRLIVNMTPAEKSENEIALTGLGPLKFHHIGTQKKESYDVTLLNNGCLESTTVIVTQLSSVYWKTRVDVRTVEFIFPL